MDGKVLLITGATSGIGQVAATTLAKTGATVVIAGRDPDKARAVLDSLRVPTAHVLLADLSHRAGVEQLAADFLARFDRLDVLINNAGGIFSTRQLTADGLERTFGLNHMSYFRLTHHLLERLKSTPNARIVNVASDAHKRTHMHWDDLQFERSYPQYGWVAYRQSKLCNVLFTRALAQRLSGSGVTVNSLHPGFVETGFARNNGLGMNLVMWLTRPLQRTPEKGAETVIWAATAPEAGQVSGRYFFDCKESQPTAEAQEERNAAKLWEISERLM